jgi:hypothetical protein
MTEVHHLSISLYQNFYASSNATEHSLRALHVPRISSLHPSILPTFTNNDGPVSREETEDRTMCTPSTVPENVHLRDQGEESKREPGASEAQIPLLLSDQLVINFMIQLQQDNWCFQMQREICKKDSWT